MNAMEITGMLSGPAEAVDAFLRETTADWCGEFRFEAALPPPDAVELGLPCIDWCTRNWGATLDLFSFRTEGKSKGKTGVKLPFSYRVWPQDAQEGLFGIEGLLRLSAQFGVEIRLSIPEGKYLSILILREGVLVAKKAKTRPGYGRLIDEVLA